MTLNTKLFVLDPVGVSTVVDLFREGQRLLHVADEMSGEPSGITPERMQTYDRPEQGIVEPAVWNADETEVIEYAQWGDLDTGVREIGNELGQGLPAILDIEYRTDNAPLYDTTKHDEYCNVPEYKYFEEDEDVCDGSRHRPTHYAVLSLDTAYGYRTRLGGCSELHASLLIAFHRWLTERGVRMAWQNEYTSEIFEGIEGLDTLTKSGAKAMDWFHGIVKPAIEAEAKAKGGTVEW